MFNQNNQELFNMIDFALWGPTGAGKDWLIYGFIKEIFERSDSQFLYQLTRPGLTPGSNEEVVFPEAPTHAPTTEARDDLYFFQRIRRGENTGRRLPHTPPKHRINILNDAGQNLTGCLEDDQEFRNAYEVLLGAQNIILVLGIPEEPLQFNRKVETTARMSDDLFTGYTSPWTSENYSKFLHRFFHLIEGRPPKNIAICLTKMDQESTARTAEETLKIRYGDLILQRIKNYQQQRHHNIQFFPTSAAGFVREHGQLVANIQGNILKEEKKWRPIKTAWPFFWIFDQIEYKQEEKNRMFFRPQNFDHYPGYPWENTYLFGRD